MTVLRHEDILRDGRYQPAPITGRDPALLARLYRFMLRLRMCEEWLIDEYHKADEMRCPVHFCVGQEAVPAALSALVRPDDYLFCHHRSHGYYLAKGAPLNALFAELFGKETGANGGLAGSQDICSPAQRFYGGAILAGGIGCAVGTGLALQLQDAGTVAVTAFGEGATDEGLFWEAANYASVARLPVVFLCENNRYATFSPQTKRQSADNISERVRAFGLRADQVFGNDVCAVHDVLEAAFDRARRNLGPTFVEAYTQRWCPHVGPENDDGVGYRTESELAFWREHCPVTLLERALLESGQLTAQDKGRLAAEINAEIAAAFAFARSSRFPRPADWTKMNFATATPLADQLLIDMAEVSFDEQQTFAIPGPY
jgi:TPP-dependent pyruvate/acetoin dehydrogenase alpha subunit